MGCSRVGRTARLSEAVAFSSSFPTFEVAATDDAVSHVSTDRLVRLWTTCGKAENFLRNLTEDCNSQFLRSASEAVGEGFVMSYRGAQVVFAFFLLSIFSGCQLINDSRGPEVRLAYADLKESTDNELSVIGDLLRRAALPAVPAPNSPDWYLAVPAGFSYVDEKCDQYLRALYDLDRNRDRFKSALLVLDKTSSAMLGATGASIKAMQIAAQAFGGTSGLADAFVDRYEFRNEPSIIFLTVDKLRSQYRAEIAGLRGSITSPGAVMLVLKNYLKICQPNSIEAVVNNYVAIAVATGNTPNSATLGVLLSSASPALGAAGVANAGGAAGAPARAAATGTGMVRDASSVRVGLVSGR